MNNAFIVRSRTNKHRYSVFNGNTWRIVESTDLSKCNISLLHGFMVPAMGVAAASLSLVCVPVDALPTGAQVVQGNVSIGTNGNVMDVNTTSAKSIVNYQSFNVAKQETVNFNLPGAQAVILNRVTGQDPSQIMGKINSNGKVVLVNPNGVFFGKDSQVNVASMMATTLNIKDPDFMAGNYQFEANANNPQKVENQGHIKADDAVNLMGAQVTNSGHIEAKNVSIAVGQKMTVDLGDGSSAEITVDEPLLKTMSGKSVAINNTGAIVAQNVNIKADIQDAVSRQIVNNTGLIQAKGISISETGEINITASGADVLNTGVITTSAVTMGQNGGNIKIESDGVALNDGTISAVGAHGGNIQFLGDTVVALSHSKMDVSGDKGGGRLLFGGDFQGKNPEIKNSSTAIVATGARFYADALTEGDGGNIVIWADHDTIFHGNNFARGGIVSGNGGFVEVSGKGTLSYHGLTDTTAPHGERGTLLLDPNNILIRASNPQLAYDELGNSTIVDYDPSPYTSYYYRVAGSPTLADYDDAADAGLDYTLGTDVVAVPYTVYDTYYVELYEYEILGTPYTGYYDPDGNWFDEHGNNFSSIANPTGVFDSRLGYATSEQFYGVWEPANDTQNGDSTIDVNLINNALSNVILQASNEILVEAAINNTHGIDIEMTAGGNIYIGNSIYNAGAVRITAGGLIQGVSEIHADGDIEITAGYSNLATDLYSGGNVSVTTTDGFMINNDSSITADGDITLISAGDLSTGHLHAEGDVYISSAAGGGIEANDVEGASITVVSDGSLFITDLNALNAINFTGSSLVTVGDVTSDLSTVTGTSLDMQVSTGNILAGAGVTISANTHVAIGSLATGGNAYLFASHGQIEASGSITADGDITIYANTMDLQNLTAYIGGITIGMSSATDSNISMGNLFSHSDISVLGTEASDDFTIGDVLSTFGSVEIITTNTDHDTGTNNITVGDVRASGRLDVRAGMDYLNEVSLNDSLVIVGTIDSITDVAAVASGGKIVINGSSSMPLSFDANTYIQANSTDANSLVINAPAGFSNYGTVEAYNSNWILYSYHPDLMHLGNMASGGYVKRYNATNAGSYTPDHYNDVNTNRLFYSTAPVLTVAADNKSKTYGDANPVFTGAITGFLDDDTLADVTGSASYTSTATNTTAAGSYAITADVSALANTLGYTFVSDDGVLTINKAPLLVTAHAGSRTYGDTAIAPTASYSGFVLGQDESVLSGSLSDGTTNTSNAGTYAITSSYSSNNYDITYTGANTVIGKASLNITAHAGSRTYGDTAIAPTASYSGFVLGQDESVLSGSLSDGTTNTSNAGTYAITSSYSSNNYDITYTGANTVIGKASLNITAHAGSRTYGDTAVAPTASYSGFVLGQDEGVLSGSLSDGTTNTSNAGTYAITSSYSSNNYDITYTGANTVIGKALLHITANNASKSFGDPHPAFSATATGFVNGDDFDDLDGALVFNTTATWSSPAGNYALTPTGLSSVNYNITFADGILTINGTPSIPYILSPITLSDTDTSAAAVQETTFDANDLATNRRNYKPDNLLQELKRIGIDVSEILKQQWMYAQRYKSNGAFIQ